ncbi:hypothetical protein OSCT_0236 [Oscillochloris trichoides DG-6]|uniref:PatA-like N-terminal domain-containing protein n=1 Tax=Oscillochloris trichoides DG-6 TaxID=765420 RepID=E1IA85_9CHLR|nr:DUF4388 domain-containing protein [Oscillochloris trichoides]EFO81839.1 hypothetical protein OSCT_0236 [Oscillochloris trichoides DG-6]
MALDGTLRDMSLSDLFQVFRMGPKTGILLLTSDEQRGIIYVAAGQLIDAAIMSAEDRSILASHDEAVIRMLLWDDARFTFRPTQSVLDRPLRMEHDSEWLVMESLRRRDDPTKVISYHTITLDTQLQLSPLPSSAESGVSLDVNQWRILSQVSSAPDLRAICEATGIPPGQAIRTVAELLSVGLVEIVPPKLQTSKVHVHEETLLHHGRAMLGSGLSAEQGGQTAGRVLLDAIMRRVRGL